MVGELHQLCCSAQLEVLFSCDGGVSSNGWSVTQPWLDEWMRKWKMEGDSDKVECVISTITMLMGLTHYHSLEFTMRKWTEAVSTL